MDQEPAVEIRNRGERDSPGTPAVIEPSRILIGKFDLKRFQLAFLGNKGADIKL